MTKEEFATQVSSVADEIIKNIESFGGSIATAACIEAACNIAVNEGRGKFLADKFREVADQIEAEGYASTH